jgi:hypothetical protein
MNDLKQKLFFFMNKKEAKKTSLVWFTPVSKPIAQLKEVFCFFFSKKKPFLTSPTTPDPIRPAL